MSDNLQPSLFEDLGVGDNPSPAVVDYDQIPYQASQPIPAGTYADLEDLKQHCEICQRCGLSEGRSHAVVSRGNPQADILIIGEGPGRNEDEQGLPFVGVSGKLLDKILHSVHLDPATDVYICNVVKCRPPDNRDPATEEVAACLPYLLEQIRLVDPQIILLTGKISAQALLGEKRGITKIRGEWRRWQDRWVMPIYHPAYLLRRAERTPGSPKWQMWQDIQEIRRKFDELNPF